MDWSVFATISSPYSYRIQPLIALNDYYRHIFSQFNGYYLISIGINLLLLTSIVYGAILGIALLYYRITNKKRTTALFPSIDERPLRNLSLSPRVLLRIIVIIGFFALLFLGFSRTLRLASKEANIIGILLLNFSLQLAVIMTLIKNIPRDQLTAGTVKGFLKNYWFFFCVMINLFIAAFLVNTVCMSLLHVPPSNQPIMYLFTKTHNPQIVGFIALQATLSAPLAEELFFRGFIFRIFRNYSSFFPAAIVSSILFAGMHKNLYIFFPLIVLGIAFAYAYHKTKNILYPISLHMAYNLLVVLYLIAFKHIGMGL